MNKRCLRTMSLLLCLAMVLSTHVVAFADDTQNRTVDESNALNIIIDNLEIGQTKSVTVSEYEMIQDLKKLTDEELHSIGYDTSEVVQIRQPLKAKEKYGNVTYTISYSSMHQKDGVTYLTTTMTWNWNVRPSFLKTDIAAMTTSENFTKINAAAKVKYYPYGNKKSKCTTEKPTVKTKDAGRGTYVKITMAKDYDTVAKDYKKVAMGGSMTVNWSVSGKYKQAGISSNYGHSILACTPSVSFGYKSGSISFTPEKKCKSGDEAYMLAKLK